MESSRVEKDFARWTPKQNFQTIQNVAAQDSFGAGKVCVQSTRVLVAVELNPDLKRKRCRWTARETTDQALYAQSRSQLQELTIRSRQDARVRAGIGNDPVQDDPR